MTEPLPNQRRALSKGLAALDTMAAIWAANINLRDAAARLAASPDSTRAQRIAAFCCQSYVEGAYQHYLDRDPAASKQPAAQLTSLNEGGKGEGVDYEAVLSDHRRMVRELDVLLNGEAGAAKQASLCDIVSQVRRTGTRIAAPAPSASPAALTDEQIAEQPARYSIDGAIAFGRMGFNKPEPGHWLMEYWSIGQQLAELGKTSPWDNQTLIGAEQPSEDKRSLTRDEISAIAGGCMESGRFHLFMTKIDAAFAKEEGK